MQVQSLDATRNLIPVTIPGNEAVVDAAKKGAEAWLLADKKAYALIVKAVPNAKLYVVRNCKSAYKAWNARRTNPFMMLDPEFTKHLVTLMSLSDTWRYCHDSLRDKVRQGEVMGNPGSSAFVINRMKQEEVEMKIAPSIVSINVLVVGGKAKYRESGDAVPGVYAAGPSSQADRRSDKSQQYQAKCAKG
ncbi:hypothetical protein B0H13DRAFT_2354502 [Mycena leptocephala]|nr:hypothetical protein B0H13DRAFT_2354502 [Mycena leptocephala]